MKRLLSPLRSYLAFARSDPRFIVFGFALTMASSFGQTFFIALFSPHIRSGLDLSDGEFGLLYTLATLASAITLIWAGGLVDRVGLRTLTMAVCAGMCAASALMAWMPSIAVLALAVYLLRLNGQGLLGHISLTSMARYFDTSRGKAISIASLGYSTGEAMLPLLAVTAMAAIGWRQTWLVISALFVAVLVPLVSWLMRGHDLRHRRHLDDTTAAHVRIESADGADAGATAVRHWTRAEVVRDWRFYLLMPAALMPPFVVTGIFFHQVRLVEEKGWTMAWFASCFIAFAAAQFPASLGFGELIDQFGARRSMPFFLVPLGLAMVVLGFATHWSAALVAMLLMGLTAGAIGPLLSSMLAEMYGVRHLGAIRSLSAALMVFATSLSPFIMGAMIDRGVRIASLAMVFVVLIVIASVLLWVAVRKRHDALDH